MTPEQLEALKEWVRAEIACAISDAFRQEGLHESIRRIEAETELRKAFGVDET